MNISPVQAVSALRRLDPESLLEVIVSRYAAGRWHNRELVLHIKVSVLIECFDQLIRDAEPGLYSWKWVCRMADVRANRFAAAIWPHEEGPFDIEWDGTFGAVHLSGLTSYSAQICGPGDRGRWTPDGPEETRPTGGPGAVIR
jgi:hypothetical protein